MPLRETQRWIFIRDATCCLIRVRACTVVSSDGPDLPAIAVSPVTRVHNTAHTHKRTPSGGHYGSDQLSRFTLTGLSRLRPLCCFFGYLPMQILVRDAIRGIIRTYHTYNMFSCSLLPVSTSALRRLPSAASQAVRACGGSKHSVFSPYFCPGNICI